MFSYIIAALLAYLLGSIPTGFLLAKAKGIDIRKVGSGNIGATNAFRVLGKGPASLVLVVDALKGYAACHFLAWGADQAAREYHAMLAGLCAILGHNFTCWLRFKGGKGIATSAGVLAALVPATFVIALSTWIVLFLLTRYVSIGSIAAALSLPVATWLTHGSLRLIAVTGILCVLALIKHKENIERLLRGTERRVEWKKKTGVQEEAR